MDNSLIDEIIKQLSHFSPSIERIGLQDYGEPFLHKDIFEIIKKIANILPNCKIHLNTNGILLTENLIEKILQSKIDAIIFSLDAADDITYKKIRNGGSFIKVIKNIKLLILKREFLRLKKPTVATNFVIMRTNLHEINNYIELGKSMNLDEIRFVFPFGIFESDKNEILQPLNEQQTNEYSKQYLLIKNELKENTYPTLRVYPLPEITPNECMLDCSFNGKCSFYIDTIGDVYPCCVIAAKGQEGNVEAIAMGNCCNQSLQEIWNSTEFIRFRENFFRGNLPMEICKNCSKYYGI